LLFQRDEDINDNNANQIIFASNTSLPTHFTLLDPLQEVKPLSFLPPLNSLTNNWLPEDFFVCCTSLKIVCTLREVPLMVMYDTREKKHSVWAVRRERHRTSLTPHSSQYHSPRHNDSYNNCSVFSLSHSHSLQSIPHTNL
jgi:hypothetical protein